MNRLRLPGLVCEDASTRRLARALATKPVWLIAMPPGYPPEDALTRLVASIRDIGGPPVELTHLRGIGVGAVEATLQAVSEAAGWPKPACVDVATLVLANAEHLTWPRTIAMLVAADVPAQRVREIVWTASEVAAATKNAPGPLSFIIMLRGDIELTNGLVPEVWEPLQPWIEPLPFLRGERSLVDAGFDAYLSCRIYWESAGQPEYIRALEALVPRASELAMAPDTDQRIDDALDRLLTAEESPAHRLVDQFGQAFDKAAARGVLRTGAAARSRVPLWQLLVSGLAWYPPASPRAFITPVAARQLSTSREFVSQWGLTPDALAGFRRAVRHNHLLASWVLNLTSHVERELVAVCQQAEDLDSKLERLGLAEKLTRERERIPTNLAYDTKADLVEYASFWELQRLILETDLARRFPASATMLNRIRQVRNLSAHLHPVTWTAIRSTLSVLGRISVTTA